MIRLVAVAFAGAAAACACATVAVAGPWFEATPNPAQPGDIVLVRAKLPPRAQGGAVHFDGRTFPGFVAGGLLHAYLGVDLDVSPGRHPLRLDFGVAVENGEIVVVGRTFAEERLRVARKYTHLDPATERRVADEATRLRALWSRATPSRLWSEPFVMPVKGAPGSPFGLRRFFNGMPRSPHAGLDIKAATGTIVRAANDGRVALAGDLFFTGNTVVVDHGLGLYTIYAHLSRVDVAEGAAVWRGQPIGRVGATGRVTGPHLHWGAKLGGARVDPLRLPGLEQ